MPGFAGPERDTAVDNHRIRRSLQANHASPAHLPGSPFDDSLAHRMVMKKNAARPPEALCMTWPSTHPALRRAPRPLPALRDHSGRGSLTHFYAASGKVSSRRRRYRCCARNPSG